MRNTSKYVGRWLIIFFHIDFKSLSQIGTPLFDVICNFGSTVSYSKHDADTICWRTCDKHVTMVLQKWTSESQILFLFSEA